MVFIQHGLSAVELCLNVPFQSYYLMTYTVCVILCKYAFCVFSPHNNIMLVMQIKIFISFSHNVELVKSFLSVYLSWE